MQQFAVKSWFFEFLKKTYVVLIHPGWGWSGTVKFPIITSSFLLLSQFAWIGDVLGHSRTSKKQKHYDEVKSFSHYTSLLSLVSCFFLFHFHAVSPLHKVTFAPLYAEKVLLFTFEHLSVKYSIGFLLHFRWLSNF